VRGKSSGPGWDEQLSPACRAVKRQAEGVVAGLSMPASPDGEAFEDH
jgi:hypothetical protein